MADGQPDYINEIERRREFQQAQQAAKLGVEQPQATSAQPAIETNNEENMRRQLIQQKVQAQQEIEVQSEALEGSVPKKAGEDLSSFIKLTILSVLKDIIDAADLTLIGGIILYPVSALITIVIFFKRWSKDSAKERAVTALFSALELIPAIKILPIQTIITLVKWGRAEAKKRNIT